MSPAYIVAIALVVGGALTTNLAKDPPTANIGLTALLLGLAIVLAKVALAVSTIVTEM